MLTLASLNLAVELSNQTVHADILSAESGIQPSQATFSFTATVVDSEGKILAGKPVSLYDITEGKRTLLQTVTSDQNGQALFSNLPINRSISVAVDGEMKGYTLRTSEANTSMAASFTTQGKGTKNPIFSKEAIDIHVLDQDGQALAGKTVSLKADNGRLIETIKTNTDGLAHFNSNILDGTFYDYYVDGIKYGQATPGADRSVFLDANSPSDNPQNPKVKQGTFSFTASAIGKNGKLISGKSVELYDITDGTRKKVSSKVTDDSGKAIFTDLPLSRNISVFIDGQAQGYTVRTSENGDQLSSAFYFDEDGSQLPSYSTKPLTITVLDENGEPISNQYVSLTNSLNQEIAQLKTDKSGKAIFKDKLMEGTFYTFSVNGIKMYALTPGSDVSAYLKADQIRKENDPTNKTKEADKQVQLASSLAKKENVTKSPSQPVTGEKSIKEDKKSPSLPKAGDQAISILSTVGVVIMGIASLFLIILKKISYLS
ncbi:LPXTG cell wall anchor domain-containing protein [Streptococcus didelphis]|uniref:LPXTG cell wall anchor domain-containing protein n=1 Tax=Streptococcus didelphis TaxID=102886 RepID=UPI0027D2717A|nr:LPXTG cell wall anchor domain-containing protein [Streptococcus didelphis]WMB29015.1 LPXTG cell wall anchor domain-containing protein [Streptococcus didelphis]